MAELDNMSHAVHNVSMFDNTQIDNKKNTSQNQIKSILIGTTYTLNKEDEQLAFDIAKQRTRNINDEQQWRDFVGVAGEIAVHRWLDLPIDESSPILQTATFNTAEIDPGDVIIYDQQNNIHTTIDVKTTSMKQPEYLYVQAHKRFGGIHDYYILVGYSSKTKTCTFYGAIFGCDVIHPLFSPHTRGIIPVYEINNDKIQDGQVKNTQQQHHQTSYQVPLCFLGDFPNCRETAVYQVPRTGTQLILLADTLTNHDMNNELQDTNIITILNNKPLVQTMAKRLDIHLGEPRYSLSEWSTLFHTGLVSVFQNVC